MIFCTYPVSRVTVVTCFECKWSEKSSTKKWLKSFHEKMTIFFSYQEMFSAIGYSMFFTIFPLIPYFSGRISSFELISQVVSQVNFVKLFNSSLGFLFSGFISTYRLISLKESCQSNCFSIEWCSTGIFVF